MWDVRITELEAGKVRRHELIAGKNPVSWAETLALWQTDAGFQDFFIRRLHDTPFAACFWETPPVTIARLDEPFEFVLADAPQLRDARADDAGFREYLSRKDGETVVAFDNLGGDARLIAPCPGHSEIDGESNRETDYAHLAAFTRTATTQQQRRLWARVGLETTRRVGPSPLWVSTSGLGIYWLHIRLDSVPKYYTHAPYRKFSTA